MALQAEFAKMKEEYLSVEHRVVDGARESVMVLEIETADASLVPFDQESTAKVLNAVELFHSGVIRMSYDVEGLVETSINLSSVQSGDSGLKLHSFARSSSDVVLNSVQDSLEAYASAIGASITPPLNRFPGWIPKIDSLSLTEMKAAHREVMAGRDARVYAVHAGLECGLIQAVYPS